MSTGMRKWMEKDCPDIPSLPAEVSIGREELRQLRDELAQLKNENEALRAEVHTWRRQCKGYWGKIRAMEQQEPVATVWRCDNGHIHGSCEQALPMGAKLYALPGAKGEEK